MSKDNKASKKKEILKDVGWFALKTTAISGAVLGGVAIAVPALGFTAGGVAVGSMAAAYQSAFLGGTIASGSAFAVLQSVGAVGLAASTQAAVVAASAVTAGAHTVAKKFKRKKNEEEVDSCNCEKEKKICSCTKVIEPNKKKNGEANTCKHEKDQVCCCTKECCASSKKHKNDECDCNSEALVSESSPKKDNKESKILNESNDVMSEASPESIDKWKNLQLTEDMTITQHILKRNKY